MPTKTRPESPPPPAAAAARDVSSSSLNQTLRRLPLLRAMVLAERRTRSRLIDRWLRIQTEGEYALGFNPAATRFHDPRGYQPMDYLWLRRFIRKMNLSPDDVVYDLGCGMGRTLCLFARQPLRLCVGIEYAPELAAIAERNAASLRGRRSPVEIRVCDACEADYADGTVFWMFNAFGAATLRAVLARIGQTLERSPRVIRFFYANPRQLHELKTCGWLTHVRDVRSRLLRTHWLSCWEGRPGGETSAYRSS